MKNLEQLFVELETVCTDWTQAEGMLWENTSQRYCLCNAFQIMNSQYSCNTASQFHITITCIRITTTERYKKPTHFKS